MELWGLRDEKRRYKVSERRPSKDLLSLFMFFERNYSVNSMIIVKTCFCLFDNTRSMKIPLTGIQTTPPDPVPKESKGNRRDDEITH